MKKTISSLKTVAFKIANPFNILAVYVLTQVGLIGLIDKIFNPTGSDLNDPNTRSAEALTTDQNDVPVTDVNMFQRFVNTNKWLTVPSVNFLVRLVTNKSRMNLVTYFEDLRKTYSGIELINAFWNHVNYLVELHREALSDATVTSYVDGATLSDLPKGQKMLTIKGTEPLTNIQALAVETRLLLKYGRSNQMLVITFNIPGTIGLTAFFGSSNSAAADEFIAQMYTQCSDVESQYEGGKPWTVAGHVIFTEESAIPEEKRSDVLNGTVATALNRTTFQETKTTA